MGRDAFSGFHPIVNMLYFVAVLGFSMFMMHPVLLGISLVCAVMYSAYLNGRRTVRMGLVVMLPLVIITAVLNPLFNHAGGTMLLYLPNGNPLTLEATVFGLFSAVTLVTVITWFSCFSQVMTSDKFVYLFGRVIPALSLILSMALRFVPRFRAQIKVISNAQRCIGCGVMGGSLLEKAKNGIRILSIMVTWALENAIETADSMKGRGYGLPGRTAFSIFRFDRRDAAAIAFILVCAAAVLVGAVTEVFRFRFFPTIRAFHTGAGVYIIFLIYFALALFPIIVNLKEDFKWKHLKSKT